MDSTADSSADSRSMRSLVDEYLRVQIASVSRQSTVHLCQHQTVSLEISDTEMYITIAAFMNNTSISPDEM